MINEEKDQSIPQILEIVGLAGSGKKTILRSLTQRNERYRQSQFIFNTIEYIPSLLDIAPLLLRIRLLKFRDKNSRRLAWHEIKFLLYLRTVLITLQRKTSHNELIVLNHNIVFIITSLHAFVLDAIKNRDLEKWWDNMLRETALLLDMVICLDAPDEVLLDRINKRKTWHRIKGLSEKEAQELLSSYRTSYEYVISRLIAINGRLKVIRFNTHEDSLEQIVDKIIAVFNRGGNGSKS